jgi:hypothetical protein
MSLRPAWATKGEPFPKKAKNKQKAMYIFVK